jgi:hypothetical protein
MLRAALVILSVVVLLAVGWFFGQRPISAIRKDCREKEAALEERQGELEGRALLAEARGYLWEARAQLLLATHDVEARNFGTAAERTSRARELITRAASVPGNRLDLGPARDTVESALTKVGAMETDSRVSLQHAAAEIGRLLEATGEA